MVQKTVRAIQTALWTIAGNVGLYVFTAFLVTGILCMEPMIWYREQVDLVNRYVVFPWGMALCLMRIERNRRLMKENIRKDIQVLFVLLLWIILPFALRFGVTFNNIASWYNHAVVYFGIYALLSERDAQERERVFDLFVLLCGILTLVLSGALLYCAATAKTFYHGAEVYGFGLIDNTYICLGLVYTLSGMMLLCLAMVTFAGITRSRTWPMRVLYAIATAMALVAIVLTQSRTARYAGIVALSAGAYSMVIGHVRIKGRTLHHLAAASVAAVVLVTSYTGAARLTDAALVHYAKVQNARMQGTDVAVTDWVLDAIGTSALAEETEAPSEVITPQKARPAIDGTFSDRTNVWKNLIKLWKENPRHFIIGNGIGRTGSRIVEGTIHEKAGAVQVHNTYLQHTADFGLIGTLLLALFFTLIFRPVLRVFLASGERRKPGYTAMCMLVLACLATGMMESAPLGGLSPMNMMLIFALALLVGRGEDLALL